MEKCIMNIKRSRIILCASMLALLLVSQSFAWMPRHRVQEITRYWTNTTNGIYFTTIQDVDINGYYTRPTNNSISVDMNLVINEIVTEWPNTVLGEATISATVRAYNSELMVFANEPLAFVDVSGTITSGGNVYPFNGNQAFLVILSPTEVRLTFDLVDHPLVGILPGGGYNAFQYIMEVNTTNPIRTPIKMEQETQNSLIR